MLTTDQNVFDENNLLAALRRKDATIVVVGPLIGKMRQLERRQLTDRDRLGFDVGSRGVLTVVEFVLNRIFHSFEGKDAEETEINERILNLYTIDISDAERVVLTLKQLGY